MSSTPGMILAMNFSDVNVTKNIQSYDRYVEYMDRPNAITNDLYNDYLNDSFHNKDQSSVKTSNLFTAQKDSLTNPEKDQLKKEFKSAYDKNMIMWTPIISFDNAWLAQNSLFNKNTGQMDETAFKEFTRLSMKEFLKRENLEMSAVWTASVHYNTDNIHVHIAITEPNPTRKKIQVQLENGQIIQTYKAKVKGDTIKAMKSKIVGNILEKTLNPVNQKLDKIIKQDIIKTRNHNLFLKDSELKKMFAELYKNLPEHKQKWNYATLSRIPQTKILIDKLSKKYIDDYHKTDFETFEKTLKLKENEYKKAYGSKDNFVYNNTIKDLYKRMGNSILTECKQYQSRVTSYQANGLDISQALEKLKKLDIDNNRSHLSSSVARLRRSLSDDFETQKNQMEYQNLKQQIEYEKSL